MTKEDMNYNDIAEIEIGMNILNEVWVTAENINIKWDEQNSGNVIALNDLSLSPIYVQNFEFINPVVNHIDENQKEILREFIKEVDDKKNEKKKIAILDGIEKDLGIKNYFESVYTDDLSLGEQDLEKFKKLRNLTPEERQNALIAAENTHMKIKNSYIQDRLKQAESVPVKHITDEDKKKSKMKFSRIADNSDVLEIVSTSLTENPKVSISKNLFERDKLETRQAALIKILTAELDENNKIINEMSAAAKQAIIDVEKFEEQTKALIKSSKIKQKNSNRKKK